MGSLPPELAGRIEGASAHPERSIVRADRIARLLNKTLHLQAWPLDLLRFRVRPAHQVWESTYATLPELAGLLRLAFLQGGFKRARVVPITSRSGIDLAAPSEAESLWIAATWPGEDEIWLQVGGRPGRPGKAALLGASSLAGAPPEDLPRRGGVVSVTGHLRLTNEGNLQADLSLVLAGTAFNPELAALEGVENQLGNWGAQLGGAKVDKISLYELSGTRARARLRFSGGRCTRDKAGILQLELPLPPSSPALLLAGLHATKCRGLTRIPGGPWVEEVDLVLAEPHFADPVAVPPPLSVKNRLGSLSLVLERAGDTLRLRYRLALEQAVVPPGERPLLRALLAPLQRPGTRALIFRIPDGK